MKPTPKKSLTEIADALRAEAEKTRSRRARKAMYEAVESVTHLSEYECPHRMQCEEMMYQRAYRFARLTWPYLTPIQRSFLSGQWQAIVRDTVMPCDQE